MDNDFRVEPLPDGTPDRNNPNVVWAGNASRRPAVGYTWVSEYSDDFSVELFAEGTPDVDNANVIWAGDGSRRPASGYDWVSSDSDDFRVELFAEGTPDRDNANVVWVGDGSRRPAPGFDWVSSDPDDLRVESIAAKEAEAEAQRQQQAAAEAEAEAERQRQAEVEAEAERQRQAEAEVEALWESSRVLLYDGRWADAEDNLRQYLLAYPDDPWSHSRLGYALLKQERYAEAIEAARQAVRLAPYEAAFLGDLVLSLDSYAWTLAVQGQLAEVAGLYAEAVDAAQGDPALGSKLAGLLNDTYQAAAALPDGTALREMAAQALVTLDPASVYNQVLLGETLFVSGDAAGAKAAYLEATRLRPGDQELYGHAAKRLIELGDPKAAHVLLLQALQAAPNDANRHLQMAKYFQETGQPEAAEREFARARELSGTTPEAADEPYAAFEGVAPDVIGQACGIAGVSSDACPKSFELRGMNVRTRFAHQVDSIPPAARVPEIMAVIEAGQEVGRRIDENEKRLEQARAIPANDLEVSTIENEIRNDEIELKKTEKKLANFSLQAKLKQLNAGLAKDREANPDGESGSSSAQFETKDSDDKTSGTEN